MKTYDFPAYVSFGKMDNAETVVAVDLTDDEAALLESCAASRSYFHLDECRELGDLYAKVYRAANEQITAELRMSDKEYGTGYCDYAEDDDWTASDTYLVGVNFPVTLQMLGEDDE